MNTRKIVLSFAAVAACVCGAFGATYYASPNEGPDSTKDCSSPENAGYILTAIEKARGAKNVASRTLEGADEAVLLPGDYDFSGIRREDVSTVSNLFLTTQAEFRPSDSKRRYFKIRGDGNDPEKVRIIGPGLEQNVRFINIENGSLYLMCMEGVCVTNFGIADANGGAILPSGTPVTDGTPNIFSNCVFRCCTAKNGGAIYGGGMGAVYFYDCKFFGNKFTNLYTGSTPSVGGGAIYFGSCWRCEFWNNGDANWPTTNKARGGACYSVNVTDCLFVGNYAINGVTVGNYNTKDPAPKMVRCVVSNQVNTAGVSDVIVHTYDVEDSLFIDNAFGGNICAAGIADTTVKRSLFYRNTCAGGPFLTAGCYNCVIFSNVCSSGATGGTGLTSGATYNCLIVSNDIGKSYGRVYTGSTHYNDLALATFGGGSLTYSTYVKGLINSVADTDPHPNTTSVVNFVNDAGAAKAIIYGTDSRWGIPGVPIGIKYRKTLCGTGTNLTTTATTIWTADSVDYAGRPRLRGDLVDIGVFTWRPKGLMLLVR